MRLAQAWIVTQHDLGLLRRRRSVFGALVALPLGVGVGFPLLVRYILETSKSMPPGTLENLLGAFAFWFVIAAATLPVSIASYSLVGEKIEKSLEPLLATPTTDSEILFGKVLAALLPTLLAVWAGSAIFMALCDRIVASRLGAFYYPNVPMLVMLFALVPLTCLVAVELAVIVSSRVSDVRSAQQISGLLFLPFLLLYITAEIGAITLDTTTMLYLAGLFAAAALALFYSSRRIFGREEILTRWK